jgi:thioredoxin 1
MDKTDQSNPIESKAVIAEVAEGNFEQEVLRSEQPVLVEFWAPWSRPCQILDSVLLEVAAACAGKAKVVKVNGDSSLYLSLWYDIPAIPTLLCFIDGKLRVRIVGTASKEAILAKLKPFDIPV